MKKHLFTTVSLALIWALAGSPGHSAEATYGLSLYGPAGLKYKPGQPYVYANPKAPKGGHLVLSDFGAFTKLNPGSLKGVPAPGIAGFIFQTPMDSSADDDEPFSQYGNLVEKVELADDRMSMIYHIYKNARFSDGDEAQRADTQKIPSRDAVAVSRPVSGRQPQHGPDSSRVTRAGNLPGRNSPLDLAHLTARARGNQGIRASRKSDRVPFLCGNYSYGGGSHTSGSA